MDLIGIYGNLDGRIGDDLNASIEGLDIRLKSIKSIDSDTGVETGPIIFEELLMVLSADGITMKTDKEDYILIFGNTDLKKGVSKLSKESFIIESLYNYEFNGLSLNENLNKRLNQLNFDLSINGANTIMNLYSGGFLIRMFKDSEFLVSYRVLFKENGFEIYCQKGLDETTTVCEY